MESKNFEFNCEYKGCEKAYSTKYNLKRHLECVHEGIKRFQCDLCSKFLSSKQNLQEHLFTHGQDKLFKCTESGCSQTFRQRSQLSNHRKMHRELFLLKEQMKIVEKEEVGNPIIRTEGEVQLNYFDSLNEGDNFPALPKISGPQTLVKLPKIIFS